MDNIETTRGVSGPAGARDQDMQIDSPTEAARFDRRAALVKMAAGTTIGAAAMITSSKVVLAASCCASTSPAVLIATCQPAAPHSGAGVCRTYSDTTVSVCRDSATRTMRLAADSAGLTQPYFDELGVLTVTSPTGAVQIRNIIRWQNTCRNPAGTDINIGGGSPCGPQTGPSLDVTSAFGSECGLFSVRLEARNGFTPYGYNTCWIVPS